MGAKGTYQRYIKDRGMKVTMLVQPEATVNALRAIADAKEIPRSHLMSQILEGYLEESGVVVEPQHPPKGRGWNK